MACKVRRAGGVWLMVNPPSTLGGKHRLCYFSDTLFHPGPTTPVTLSQAMSKPPLTSRGDAKQLYRQSPKALKRDVWGWRYSKPAAD
jgi:hypothetical protein